MTGQVGIAYRAAHGIYYNPNGYQTYYDVGGNDAINNDVQYPNSCTYDSQFFSYLTYSTYTNAAQGGLCKLGFTGLVGIIAVTLLIAY